MLFLYALPLLVILVTWGGIVFHLHRVSKFGHATRDESDETKGARACIENCILDPSILDVDSSIKF